MEAFGAGDHFWHGEGFWSVKYEEPGNFLKDLIMSKIGQVSKSTP